MGSLKSIFWVGTDTHTFGVDTSSQQIVFLGTKNGRQMSIFGYLSAGMSLSAT